MQKHPIRWNIVITAILRSFYCRLVLVNMIVGNLADNIDKEQAVGEAQKSFKTGNLNVSQCDKEEWL